MSKRKAELIRAITHIPLTDGNRGKLAALDAVWTEYRELCQRYVTYFCAEEPPDPHAEFIFESVLSARWQRVAVQQGAGLAQSWRTQRTEALAVYQDQWTHYQQLSAEEQAQRQLPTWTEWAIPTLKAVCIQANANVVLQVADDYAPLGLEAAEQGQYDFWLRVSTLDKGQPVYLPVKLADYHRQALIERDTQQQCHAQ